jgi:peptidoglycan/LPS O-acetylase OafA/YrhL
MAGNASSASFAPRLPGIDSLRFWLALWVYFSHFGFLPFAVWIGRSTPVRNALTGMTNNIFNGAAAVIGFFVISGLCIHYPFRSKPVELLPFYVRRYFRILIPLGVALGLSRIIENDLLGFYQSILWSLICEEVYYAIYPILRVAIQKLGWKRMLSVAYAAAVGVILSKPHTLIFQGFGPSLTWVVGLPCWLLGCYLAETAAAASLQEVSLIRIWAWRLFVWGLGSLTSVLRFHSGIGFPITLTLMGPLLYHWLRLELGRKKRLVVFEYAGKFSYSIYLMHGMAVSILGIMLSFPTGNNALTAILRLIFVIVFSYCFFLLVEQPSHQFARYVARVIPQIRRERELAKESSR